MAKVIKVKDKWFTHDPEKGWVGADGKITPIDSTMHPIQEFADEAAAAKAGFISKKTSIPTTK